MEMNTEEPFETLEKVFPFFKNLSLEEQTFLCNHTASFSYEKGSNLHDGNTCTGAIIVKTGCLRLYILSDEGKEITLYRLFPGDLCMLSASCVIKSITFDVIVDAEEDSDCLIVAGAAFSAISEKNKDAKIFALEMAVSRFSDVMWVMQQILFMSFDKRLAIFLLDELSQHPSEDTVHLTHEQIAKYMGSAREVVSRMLKYFASEKMVEVSRGGVKILDKKKLRKLTL